MHDYLDSLEPIESKSRIEKLRSNALKKLADKKFSRFFPELYNKPKKPNNLIKSYDETIRVSTSDELWLKENCVKIKKILELFKPWKKGPYCIFENYIDAEWRSDFKWNRLKNHIPSLDSKKVADIGCNNGYFMYRMLSVNPELIIGFEPALIHWLLFDFINYYTEESNIFFEPFGLEYLDLYPNYFDVIFCLGILYHHRSPIDVLTLIKSSMSSKASLVIDCQGITSKEAVALCPTGRYANARGVWFLPSKSCLENWLHRAGFKKIKFFYSEKLETNEQRSTNWAPIKSLESFLDPVDNSKTIEGYPAPLRHYVICKKP